MTTIICTESGHSNQGYFRIFRRTRITNSGAGIGAAIFTYLGKLNSAPEKLVFMSDAVFLHLLLLSEIADF
jgi:hypothetical protein